MITEKLHSRLSASSSSRWLNCPGSVKLSEQAPPRLTHPSANEGTVAHFVAETAYEFLSGKGGTDPRELLGKEINKVVVDRQMIMSANIYAHHICSLHNPTSQVALEKRLDLPHIHNDMFGTTDCVIINEDKSVHIVDYKFGEWPVSAKENPQLIYYAIGACKDFTPLFVDLHIVQPRSRDGETIKTWRLEKDELYKWENIFREKAQMADVGTPIVKGSWCRFCPALDICELHPKKESPQQVL